MRFILCLILGFFYLTANVQAGQSAQCTVSPDCELDLQESISDETSGLAALKLGDPIPDYSCTATCDCSVTIYPASLNPICLALREIGSGTVFNTIIAAIDSNPLAYAVDLGVLDNKVRPLLAASISAPTTAANATFINEQVDKIKGWWAFKVCRNQSECGKVANSTPIPDPVAPACSACSAIKDKPGSTRTACADFSFVPDSRFPGFEQACQVLSSPVYNKATFDVFYRQVCPSGNCQNTASRVAVAGTFALTLGYRFNGLDTCRQYIIDYVDQEEGNVWSTSTYGLLWNCRRAFGPSNALAIIKSDLTKWQKKMCTSACDVSIQDPLVQEFCAKSPSNNYPWPIPIKQAQ
ncbi:MAG: hypothetical protein HQL20_01790 [Candidatus Omnitrophica bacterium]|nr:hypothetical protein [Candidatus Omnitrophota bacterium]